MGAPSAPYRYGGLCQLGLIRLDTERTSSHWHPALNPHPLMQRGALLGSPVA